MHQVLQLSQVKPTRSSILDCANTVQSAMNGLKRLEQWDASSMFTSIIEDLLPTQLRAKWADETISSKKVPPIDKLIAFLEERADQPQYAEKMVSTPSSVEKKTFSKQKAQGLKGSVHAANPQPSQTPSNQSELQSQKTPSSGRNQSAKSKPTHPNIPVQSVEKLTMLLIVISLKRRPFLKGRNGLKHTICVLSA